MKEDNSSNIKEKLEYHQKLNKELVHDNLSFFKCFDMHKSREPKFSHSDVFTWWEKYLEEPDRLLRQDALSLYVHVPFCVRKCNFCCYDSFAYTKDIVPSYLKYIKKECESFTVLFKKVKFDTIYFGGGTPNILSVKDLTILLETVFSSFKPMDNAEIKVECNPSFSDTEKLKIYRNYGFNRISFGVQSFDPDILNLANRPYQREKEVYDAIRTAEQLGFEDVNMDIMFGLEGDNNAKFLSSLDKAFSTGVGNIIIYKLMPTPLYYEKFLDQKIILNNSRKVFERIYDMDSIFLEIEKIANAHKYAFNLSELNYSSANMGIGFKRPDLATKFDMKKKNYSFYTDFPMSCLGLGPFSMSHIFGQSFYKNMNRDMRIRSEQIIYTGNRVELEAEIIQDMASQMDKSSSIDIGLLNKKYSLNINDLFKESIGDLSSLNLINISKNILKINDNLKIKPAECLLFFISPKHLKSLIKQKQEFTKPPGV